jgi:hypothetical protein
VADLSNSDVVGDLTINGPLTSYNATVGGIPCSVTLLNGAAAPVLLSCVSGGGGGGGGGGPVDASAVTYTPAVDGYWVTLPTSVANALDQLAEVISDGYVISEGGSSGPGAYGSLTSTANSIVFVGGTLRQVNVGWNDGGSFDTTVNVSDGTITSEINAEFVIDCALTCNTQVNGSFLQFQVYQNSVPLSFTQASGSAQGNYTTIAITAMVAASANDVFSIYASDNESETVIISGNFNMFSPQGPQGLQGPAGQDGYDGYAGPPGPPGPSGGSADYSLFYALMPGDNAATIGVGTAVAFPQDGPTTGTIARNDSSTFNLPAVGDYEVTWQVSISEPGQLQLALNGVGLANTVVGRATGTSQLVGSTIITTTSVNSALSVINPVGNSTALTVTPIAGGASAVSATLTIKTL